MKTYPFNAIIAGNVFHAEYLNYKGSLKKHYFYCVYSQVEDKNNSLTEDIVGVMISTNDKFEKLAEQGMNDYNVEVEINGRKAWVCSDKVYRFSLQDDTIKLQKKVSVIIPKNVQDDIVSKFSRFYLEATRQMLENVNKHN